MTLLNLVKIPIKTIDLSPGSHLLIPGVSWEQYEALLVDLGPDRRIPRINYCRGALEIMSPLPAHERPHRIIADIVKVLLDGQDRDWEDFGSTTFKKAKQAGLEPDTCFYIQNAAQVRSLMRLNLEADPPPDLAIEADVTSKTTLETYGVLGVPEVWIYHEGTLTIQRLQGDRYETMDESGVFPDLPISNWIPQLINQALQRGTRQMLKDLRQQLQSSESL